ncbi:O-acetyl-ADP-ribose deacetylase, partial [Dysosmobacter welbionis]
SRPYAQGQALQILQRLLSQGAVPAPAGPAGERPDVSAPRHGGIAMRHLLNTLFVNSEDIYLSLDGENVVASRGKQEMARYPLHILSGIVSFSYAGASPALMGACVQRDVSLAFCTPRGRFLARVSGESSGNVLLQRTQYRTADDPGPCCRIARNMIFGKVHNTRWSVERTRRDHGLRID